MKIKHEDGLVYKEVIAGVWRPLGKPIDALLTVVREHLGITVKADAFIPLTMATDLRIDSAQLSRIRKGTEPMPNAWLLRMHAYSGLPLTLLEEIAGVKSIIQPHAKARPLETK